MLLGPGGAGGCALLGGGGMGPHPLQSSVKLKYETPMPVVHWTIETAGAGEGAQSRIGVYGLRVLELMVATIQGLRHPERAPGPSLESFGSKTSRVSTYHATILSVPSSTATVSKHSSGSQSLWASDCRLCVWLWPCKENCVCDIFTGAAASQCVTPRGVRQFGGL